MKYEMNLFLSQNRHATAKMIHPAALFSGALFHVHGLLKGQGEVAGTVER